MIVQKDLLKPNLYVKGDNAFVVSDADINEINESVPRLQSLGYRIPFWMEHPKLSERAAFPIKATDTAMINAAESDPWFSGWVRKVHKDDKSEIHVELEVPDEMGTRLTNTGSYVSPQFGQWIDDEGVKHKNVLHHVAATRKPVNPNQLKKFTTVALSAVDTEKADLGIDTILKPADNPAQPRRFTLAEAAEAGIQVFCFSLGDTMPAGGNAEKDQLSQSPTPGQPSGQQDSDIKSRMQQAMQILGVQVDPNSPIMQNADSMSKFLSMLLTLQTEAMGTLKSADAGNSNSELSEQATVIAMSKENENVVVTPVQAQDDTRIVQMSQTLVAQEDKIRVMSQTNAALMGRVTSTMRADYMRRIDALKASGRSDVAIHTELTNMATAFQFSADSDPDKSELEFKIGVYEKLPEGAYWTTDEKIRVMSLQETKMADLSGGFFGNTVVTNDRVNEILQEYAPTTPALDLGLELK